jgi:hypothetical protein
MKIQWHKVTWYSKLLSLLFFIFVFLPLAFYIGYQYREYKQVQNNIKAFEAERAKEVQYHFITEDNIKVPQINNFHDQNIEKMVNDDLRKTLTYGCDVSDIDDLREQLSWRQQYETKKIPDADLQKMTKEELIKELGYFYGVIDHVTYAKNDIFSIDVEASGFCGGAHPDSNHLTMTYDLATGKRSEFNELFSDWSKDKQKISDVVKKENGILKSVITPDDIIGSDDNRCTNESDMYIEPGELEYASYYINDKGLVMIPSLPHAFYACTKAYTIPISSIQAYIPADSFLNRAKQ